MQTYKKFTFRLIEGHFDDDLSVPTWHAVILRHTLTIDGDERRVSGQEVVETFSRHSEDMAREDALRRTGELMLAEPV